MNGKTSMQHFVQLMNTEQLVSIKEWLKVKSNHLEWSLKLKAGTSCQAETNMMEKDLFSCPDETIIPVFGNLMI
jgi:hypothetical protein